MRQRERHRCYIHMALFCRVLETHRMLWIPTTLMSGYYFSAFESKGQLLTRLLHRMVNTMDTVMLFVCFIRTAQSGFPDLFIPKRFLALRGGNNLRANEEILIRPLRKKKANIVERSLLKIIRDRKDSQMVVLLAHA